MGTFCLSIVYFSRDRAGIYEWPHELFILLHINARTPQQIIITFYTGVMPLETKSKLVLLKF
jgi:hypothetical protein